MTVTQQTTGASLERVVYQDPIAKFPLNRFRLDKATDAELAALSEKLGIGLSLDEMKSAHEYFRKKGRDPTDVELEALGQAWSEHCCYKSSRPLLKQHIFGVCEDQLLCREDAGVVEFDEENAYVVKIESHNHPSAIEPYGGAATGIGGVLRDVVCMGAQPVGLIDPLFFGPLDIAHKDLPPGTKHPIYLMQGVVAGIRDYGNRVGIPTIAGGISFHPSYLTNCLVNVGCVGIMKKSELTRSRAKAPGDVYIYLGGRTGRDGIHGVTFASEELSAESEEESRGAVQLGDPITKEPVIHACREAVQAGILEGMKDFGGGGLSCVTGELAWDAGLGAEVNLDVIPLKEPGLAPWEMWVSESQERMMFVVKPENVEKALHICKKWDVEAAVCGKVIEEPVIRAFYQGVKVLEFDLKFSTGGPIYDRPKKIRTQTVQWESFNVERKLGDTLLALLADPNIASKEWAIRMYDHIVRANTAIWPMQGVYGKEGPGDAVVLKPVDKSWKGLAITSDVNPRYTEKDPYWGSLAAVDEMARNLAAVGARPSSLADCLNFGNPEKPERMGDLSESIRALGDGAQALNIPFSSGNVSLYNESPHASVPPTPTLLGVGIVKDLRDCVTTDLKQTGAVLYVVGDTLREFGGSALQWHLGFQGGQVPRPDLKKLPKAIEALVSAIEKGVIRTCHDVSEGGILTAVAEMAIGGDVGATLNVDGLGKKGDLEKGGNLRPDQFLFSESPTRWIIEVVPSQSKKVEAHFAQAGIALHKVGTVGDKSLIVNAGGEEVMDVPVSMLRHVWKTSLTEKMGATDAPAKAGKKGVPT